MSNDPEDLKNTWFEDNSPSSLKMYASNLALAKKLFSHANKLPSFLSQDTKSVCYFGMKILCTPSGVDLNAQEKLYFSSIPKIESFLRLGKCGESDGIARLVKKLRDHAVGTLPFRWFVMFVRLPPREAKVLENILLSVLHSKNAIFEWRETDLPKIRSIMEKFGIVHEGVCDFRAKSQINRPSGIDYRGYDGLVSEDVGLYVYEQVFDEATKGLLMGEREDMVATDNVRLVVNCFLAVGFGVSSGLEKRSREYVHHFGGWDELKVIQIPSNFPEDIESTLKDEESDGMMVFERDGDGKVFILGEVLCGVSLDEVTIRLDQMRRGNFKYGKGDNSYHRITNVVRGENRPKVWDNETVVWALNVKECVEEDHVIKFFGAIIGSQDVSEYSRATNPESAFLLAMEDFVGAAMDIKMMYLSNRSGRDSVVASYCRDCIEDQLGDVIRADVNHEEANEEEMKQVLKELGVWISYNSDDDDELIRKKEDINKGLMKGYSMWIHFGGTVAEDD